MYTEIIKYIFYLLTPFIWHFYGGHLESFLGFFSLLPALTLECEQKASDATVSFGLLIASCLGPLVALQTPASAGTKEHLCDSTFIFFCAVSLLDVHFHLPLNIIYFAITR